ncbi:MAG: RNA polymerase sigma factor [Putridiphycobacter sp.]
MEEKELIKAVQSGDVNAFSQLVDRHKNMVYSLVLKMIGNLEDAEEVAQDSFVKAFKSIKQFKGKSKFSTWLYRITYFTAINYLRKHEQLKVPLDISSFSDDDKTAIDQLNADDQKRHIKMALNYLKPIEKTVITLFYLDEFSNKEIQEITGLSESNIKVMLLRTRKKLFGILKKMLNHELETIIKNY